MITIEKIENIRECVNRNCADCSKNGCDDCEVKAAMDDTYAMIAEIQNKGG